MRWRAGKSTKRIVKARTGANGGKGDGGEKDGEKPRTNTLARGQVDRTATRMDQFGK